MGLSLTMISRGDFADTLHSCYNIVDNVYIGLENLPKGQIIYRDNKVLIVTVGYLYEEGFDGLRNNLMHYVPHNEWCLLLDDDEVIEGYDNLRGICAKTPFNAHRLHLHQWHWQLQKPVFLKEQLYRLFKNVPNFRFLNKVHEQAIMFFVQNKYPVGGTINGGRIVHIGYDTDELSILHKLRRNFRLLWEELLTNEAKDGYLYYHLGEMRSWFGDIDGAKEAYRQALEKGLYNEKLVERINNKIQQIERLVSLWRSKNNVKPQSTGNNCSTRTD